jgi:hypothetical protein
VINGATIPDEYGGLDGDELMNLVALLTPQPPTARSGAQGSTSVLFTARWTTGDGKAISLPVRRGAPPQAVPRTRP